MEKTHHNSTINTQLVLSMALLLLILSSVVIGVAKSKQQVQVVTQAAPESELLTHSDDADSLEQDLLYLQMDPAAEELKVLNQLQ